MLIYRVSLDGNHTQLAKLELYSLINAYGINIDAIDLPPRSLILRTNQPLECVLWRASMITSAERVLNSDPNDVDWLSIFSSYYSNPCIRIPFTFMIKHRDKDCDVSINNVVKVIYKKVPIARVSLDYPQIILSIRRLIDEDYICMSLPTGRDLILHRQLKYRPYAPSTAMESLLSRVLVNLSQLVPRETFLDPFCGTGSLLIEASLIGLRAIGSDINPRLIGYAKMLLSYYNTNADVRVADAKSLPYDDGTIDGISTDPPYGISSHVHEGSLEELYRSFLREAIRVLKRGRYLVICYIPRIKLEKMAIDSGFEIIYTYSMRVHSKLTRLVSILRKK